MLFAVELFPLLLSLFIVAVVVLWFSIQNYKNEWAVNTFGRKNSVSKSLQE